MLVRSKFIVICFALSSECDLRNCLYHGFYCVSFGFPFCVHPSRCLRCPSGVLICASDEMPCYVHPSRCCFCASFEVPCYVHPSRCCVLCILRGAVLGLSWGSWRKTSPSCLRFFFPKDLFGGCFLRGKAPLEYLRLWLVAGLFFREVIYCCPRRRSLGWFLKKRLPLFLTSRCPEAFYEEEVFGIPIDDLFANEATRGNFVFCEKTSPPFLARCCLRRVLFFSLLGKLNDVCRGLGWKDVSVTPLC